MSLCHKEKLIRVSHKSLPVDKTLGYSVFKATKGNYYQEVIKSNSICDEKIIEILENEKIDYVYIKHDDFEKYSKNINKYLSDIINDEEETSLNKSAVMHRLARDTMYDLLDGQITKVKINEVSQTIDSTVEFILKDPNAVRSMLEVTTHDYYTYTHSVDVSTYALTFGSHLGLSETQLKKLGKGAMLHDLGKKRIPSEIINKNGKLTDEEFDMMKNHPSFGVDILKEMGEDDEILFSIVEQHHEKLNGKGYPKALGKDEIHPFAQIVTICDIFNALTTKRSYKPAMSTFEAFEIMNKYMEEEINLKYFNEFVKFMGKNNISNF
ncbi:MAG: HD-GYP domain-containing protein [Campylobacterota bacterium]|nr:HD-GYP domain-containing protein [Campylobacterota bacterium]